MKTSGHDLGETEEIFRAQCAEGSSALLALLLQEHAKPEPEPVTIEIKEELPDPRLEEKVRELEATVIRQRAIIIKLCDKDSLTLPKISDVLHTVGVFYNLTLAELTGPSRTKKITLPRQIAYYLGRHLTNMSTPEIGRRIGDRDHTSVCWGIRKIEDLLPHDEILRDDVDVLKSKLAALVIERQNIAEGRAA